MILSRTNVENCTAVASALVAEDLADAPGSNPGCPIRACRFKSCRAHFVVSGVRDGIWETCRIQAPVPLVGRAGSIPAGRTQAISGRW